LAKKGEKYECENCGLVVVVEDPCGCEPVELMCCSVPMKPVKAAKAKVKPVKKVKTKAKPKTKPKAKPKAKGKK
jgi:hypothetical protein